MPASAPRYETCACGRRVSTQAAARLKHQCEAVAKPAPPPPKPRQPRPPRPPKTPLRQPEARENPHCSWCADPWRAVLLGVLAQHVKCSSVAAYYGIGETTVVNMFAAARRRGCVNLMCRFCPTPVSGRRRVCAALRCQSANSSRLRTLRRQAYAKGLTVYEPLIPAGVLLPELPENTRLRTPLRPRAVTLLGGPPARRVSGMVQALKPATSARAYSYDPMRRTPIVSTWLRAA